MINKDFVLSQLFYLRIWNVGNKLGIQYEFMRRDLDLIRLLCQEKKKTGIVLSGTSLKRRRIRQSRHEQLNMTSSYLPRSNSIAATKESLLR